jgi:endonuclease/exonuclease/phosphatase family metal-dependent hydrolase
VRFATFNIENWPKNDVQVDGAFREIASLDASLVAVQEIVVPELFARTAQVELGVAWDFVYASTAPHGEHEPLITQHLGVLFDRTKWTLVSTALHDGTRLPRGRYKPTFEVRLAPKSSGGIVRVLVVHLKAGGDSHDIRAQQYVALADIVRTARASGDRVLVMGDFNATGEDDRVDLAELAARGDVTWSTESLGCSALWDRDDGCFRSRLDHLLSSEPIENVRAAGACATDGCAPESTCPRYIHDVSDHCPVVGEL